MSTQDRQASRRRYYEANRERLIAKATAYQQAHPGQSRETKRRWQDANPLARHRMQAEEWAEMFAAQQGCCYLCGDALPEDRRKSVIDHDHSCCPSAKSCSYCRRGIACGFCNTLIGLAFDDPERLRCIADNLESALAMTRQRIVTKAVQAQFGDDAL